MSGWMLLLVLGNARAECPADAAELNSHVQAATQAYQDWDWGTFDRRVQEVHKHLGCLSEVLAPPDAAALHGLFVRVGARNDDQELVEVAWRGLLALQPEFVPGADLAPPGSMLQRSYQAAAVAAPGSTEPLPESSKGRWYVDGNTGVEGIPLERTALVQYQNIYSRVESWYLQGLDPTLPRSLGNAIHDSAASAGPSGQTHIDRGRSGGTPASRKLLRGGLASFAVGFAGCLTAELVWEGTAESDRNLDLYNSMVALTLGGKGFEALGLGLVIGALAKGEW